MDAAGLRTRLQQAQAALLANGPRIAEIYGAGVLALVRLRIQRDGLIGRVYSSREVPRFFFYNKALNAAGRSYAKKGGKGTWAAFRAAQGLPADAVYLTYTGGMFRALLVRADGTAQAGVFEASLLAADQESANKVKWNTARFGNFLRPLPSEERLAAQSAADEVNRILNQYLQ
ncbi:hypothetical protein LJ737_20745 [Hymenobacter sp. 15J16-1T3B]|uniref:hypothetical protein n=1 Tax=Hymenobacter sp. 15J16-1T3B TaxID=2886941 RepID=UPI001D1222CC|nr:hypothetical protein [Hymenobacter sp. 15J16-1T3B]MCC3159682.1 hypothetical protein [Hymenobacter sp. 15J16-1T3B]